MPMGVRLDDEIYVRMARRKARRMVNLSMVQRRRCRRRRRRRWRLWLWLRAVLENWCDLIILSDDRCS